ncbi:MAG: hypothetical protein ACD_41C00349G0017 [uncultured bacterium]|nr:MAG: hypothetical protein ACD_41C00349G0017 [uncultured bacterium]HBY73185.1 hypothetical protein [Candidatus Kerfeldbacteria bacterium]
MDLKINLKKPINLASCLRQAGYHPITGSWVRHLGRGHYPRFHLYLGDKPNSLKLSLHIDQKQHTIDMPGLKRHAGEYNSTIVQEEMARLQRWVKYSESL